MARRPQIQPDAAGLQSVLEALRSNPYVERLLTDEQLRRQVLDGLAAGRSAVDRAGAAKRPGRALVRDRQLQSDLRAALAAAQAVQAALKDSGEVIGDHQRRGHGRLLAVGAGLAALGLAASSTARSTALDLLFGPEEVFDYVPADATQNGATPPPAKADAAA